MTKWYAYSVRCGLIPHSTEPPFDDINTSRVAFFLKLYTSTIYNKCALMYYLYKSLKGFLIFNFNTFMNEENRSEEVATPDVAADAPTDAPVVDNGVADATPEVAEDTATEATPESVPTDAETGEDAAKEAEAKTEGEA